MQVESDTIVLDGGRSPEDIDSRDGSLTLRLPPLTTTRTSLRIPVSPTLAGTLWSGRVAVVDRRTGAQTVVPPTSWTVGG